MATRLKKLLHHRKDNDDTPDSPTSPTQDKVHHRRLSRADQTHPALRPSMEGTGTADDSSAGFAGRQSGTYSRGGPPQMGNLGFASASAEHDDGPLSSDFSRLNIDRSRAAAYQPDSAPSQHYGDSPSRRAGGIRRVDTDDPILPPPASRSDFDDGRHSYPTGPTANTYEPAYGQHEPDSLSRPTSIPRKEVGSRTTPPGTANSHIRQSSLQKPLPTPPHGAQGPSTRDSHGTSGLTHATAGSPGTGETLTAEEVLRHAQGSSSDTTVIEKIAPAVVHETIKQEVHHIRREVVTREIHDHDYYHRILPIVDVEVLPPRHFLPVEGGGLVEIAADEVPGRGKNWVIAETTSKIPSGEPLPSKPNVFSARAFGETEGDDRRYVTAEGVERTEQTWVHPPELETGARATGQTWPMEFGRREGLGPREREDLGERHELGQRESLAQRDGLGQREGLAQRDGLGQREGLAQRDGLGQREGLGQTPTRSPINDPQTPTRSPVKEGKRRGILKNSTPTGPPAVDDRIDAPGTAL